MRIHFIGIAGSGMGQLAMLCASAGDGTGDRVSGSDIAFDPPTGPALEKAGIACNKGYAAEHIPKDADLVVVGNAIRKDNAEAVRAEELGLRRASMSATLRERFLQGRKPLVVCGTHGKTTTSTMAAWILLDASREPGWFIGGVPKNLPSGSAIGSTKKKVSAPRAPFVVEGDEYDAVFWHKKPKFFDYVGVGPDDVVIVTSVEHDHIDIYPDAATYEAQFAELARRMPEGGLLVCDAHDVRAREIIRTNAKCRVAFYGIQGLDSGDVTATWQAAIAPDGFDLYAGGSYCGRFAMRLPGAHNVRNAVGAIAACAEGFGVGTEAAKKALAAFEGVKRRQELLGMPRGIAVYDDFAHHPTAVDETLRALKSRHESGRLWAIFEPRSATACRSIHQEAYTRAFGAADVVIFAPLGRTNVPESERLDLVKLARELGRGAEAATDIDAIVTRVVREAVPGDAIALLSNGAFGGIHTRLLGALE